jgi:GNAT superfamily N-acetyltransferase
VDTPGSQGAGPRADHAAGPPPFGLVYAWWAGDPLPALPTLSALSVAPTIDANLLASVRRNLATEMAARLADGHRAYLAYWEGEPVGFGWSATRRAAIGELGLAFALPVGDRYLWDFVTLAPWRGRGIYPRLLQTILVAEASEASRFWIGHDLDNVASRKGILTAGFHEVGSIHVARSGRLQLEAHGPLDRAEATAKLMGVPLIG